MEVLLILAYAIIYFVGYYGAQVLNLLARRVLIKNLRIGGLALLVLAAAVAAYLIEFNAPAGASSFVKGQLQGRFAIGPALIVAFAVGIRMWLENRKLGKARKAGE